MKIRTSLNYYLHTNLVIIKLKNQKILRKLKLQCKLKIFLLKFSIINDITYFHTLTQIYKFVIYEECTTNYKSLL